MADSRNYHVFLSFSGVDTRKTFTGHFLTTLEQNGFKTFRDDTELKRGEKIGPGLLKAIEESRVSIIVFTKNYTSSDWCLDELVKIMDCRRTRDQIVIPIFYDGEPSDVRNQKGCYSFDQPNPSHRMQFDLESVGKWRSALTEASHLSGHVLQNVANGCESTLINNVVGDLKEKLNPMRLTVARYPVGLEHRVQRLSEFLKLGSNSDVRIVAIWGIGGIGKTTIAKEMYNRIHGKFESNCFLADVRQNSEQPNGLVQLQERLLGDLLKDRNQRITNKDNGIEVIKDRAWGRRVLLVLDDVDKKSQLNALGIDRDLLRSGSIIIVTTRDLSSLSSLRLDKVNEVYEFDVLNKHESLQLFNLHAFGKRDCLEEDYQILSKKVVSYAKGLPLVLGILGSFLSDKTVPEWRGKLKKLEKVPDHDVQGILALSFDSLDDRQKGLFLDIACFFVGMEQDLLIKILEGCGFYPETDIGVLSRCCLVSIDESNRLKMHDLIQDMAREIVRQESPAEPGKRSRLWYREDVIDVLENETGTEAIQGLALSFPKSKEQPLNAKAFAKMKSLRLLTLNFVQLSGSYEHLSKMLVWLSWKGFSLNQIPSTLIMDNLVVLDLRYSKLIQVWSGPKVLRKLKYLNLSHSNLLIETPDFKGLTSLEQLFLNGCFNLVEVHQSIKCLENLVVLDLHNCINLEKIRLSIFMNSLLCLNMFGCSKLEWTTVFQGFPPESSSSSLQLSSKITKLDMSSCYITCVPNELGSLVSLESLNLRRNNFSNLPVTITSLPQLKMLILDGCYRLESVPALPLNLLKLSACYCPSLESISMESKVVKAPCLTFYNCPKLVNNNFAYNFRRNLLRFQGMREQGEFNIFLDGSEVPRWCNYRNEGRVLRFQVPQLLGRVIQGFILCVVSCDYKRYHATTFLNYGYVVSNITKSGYGVFHASRDHGLCPGDIFFGGRTWLSYVPNRCLESKWGNYNCRLDGGDEVHMEIAAYFDSWWTDLHLDSQWVERCGVSLVYKDEIKDPDSNLPPVDENVLGDYMDLDSCDSDASDHSITISSDRPLEEMVRRYTMDLDSSDSDDSITIASDTLTTDKIVLRRLSKCTHSEIPDYCRRHGNAMKDWEENRTVALTPDFLKHLNQLSRD